MQVDLGLPKLKRLPDLARSCCEGLRFHAENLFVKGQRGRDIGNCQYQVIQRGNRGRWRVLRHGAILGYGDGMKDDAPQEECQSDQMDVARANALLAALGRPETLANGDALPPFFHQVYFWTPQPPAALGRDGHPKVGGLIPDMGLPRRMWAGGQLMFETPLIAGLPALRRSTCRDHVRKEGRSGPLGFVTLCHEIRQGDHLRLQEHQDLVYRADPDPSAPRPEAPISTRSAADRVEVQFDATLLFRYSALTFNGHRIHYDETYARTVEGYDGLVVHGPLLAQLLMLRAAEQLGPLARFRFRATAPLMHHETGWLCRDGTDLWVEGPDKRLCMRAEVEVKD